MPASNVKQWVVKLLRRVQCMRPLGKKINTWADDEASGFNAAAFVKIFSFLFQKKEFLQISSRVSLIAARWERKKSLHLKPYFIVISSWLSDRWGKHSHSPSRRWDGLWETANQYHPRAACEFRKGGQLGQRYHIPQPNISESTNKHKAAKLSG